MKKEKIKLKVGDKVYYVDDYGKKLFLIINGYEGFTIKQFEDDGGKVTKVERVVEYKTIYEAPKPILDKEEKEYLEAVLRPFRNKVKFIEKVNSAIEFENQYITFTVSIDEWVSFPYFKKGTMYKGMDVGKHYTLAELGLFEGE